MNAALQSEVTKARASLAKEATRTLYFQYAIPVLDRVAASRWLRQVCKCRPTCPSALELQRLAIGLSLAHHQYLGTDMAMRDIRAYDKQWREGYEESIKHLRAAVESAGLFQSSITVIIKAMNEESKRAPLFDSTVLGSRGRAARNPSGQARAAATILIENFCPRSSVLEPDDQRTLKLTGDELLREVGFQIDARGSSNARNLNKRKRSQKPSSP